MLCIIPITAREKIKSKLLYHTSDVIEFLVIMQHKIDSIRPIFLETERKAFYTVIGPLRQKMSFHLFVLSM